MLKFTEIKGTLLKQGRINDIDATLFFGHNGTIFFVLFFKVLSNFDQIPDLPIFEGLIKEIRAI